MHRFSFGFQRQSAGKYLVNCHKYMKQFNYIN